MPIDVTLASVTPANGSDWGGSLLTLTGEFPNQIDGNALSIDVADVPCSLLRRNSTMMQCQLAKRTPVNRTNYGGTKPLSLRIVR